MKRCIVDARGAPEVCRRGLIQGRVEELTSEQASAWVETRFKARADHAVQEKAAQRERRKQELLERLLDEEDARNAV